MAYVKLQCAIPPRFFFFFFKPISWSLLKIDGRWQIASKGLQHD